MKLIKEKKIPSDLIGKEVINDLLKVFLMNPYLKRPHLIVRDEKAEFIVDRTFHVINQITNEIKRDKAVQICEYYGNPEEVQKLKEKTNHESINIGGNEARKFNQKELKKLFEKCLKSNGAIISLNTEEQEAIIFIPIREDLEWN